MGSLYLVEAANWFREAGLSVVEYDGWRTRAKRSGGYNAYPLCVMWHHTASHTSPENDARYEAITASTAPICNVNIARDGTVWLLAAGATNTNGSGNSMWFSRGTVPANSMNSYAWGMEIANNGVGETYPQAQIDAAFIVSNAINARCGNQSSDVGTHSYYSPGRKIDPAGPVAGPWDPRTINSNQTWNINDLIAECNRRSSSRPVPPQPQPPGDTDMASSVLILEDAVTGAMYRCGVECKSWIPDGTASAQIWLRINECAGGTQTSPVDGFVYKYMKHGGNDVISSYGPIIGDRPDMVDEYGRH